MSWERNKEDKQNRHKQMGDAYIYFVVLEQKISKSTVENAGIKDTKARTEKYCNKTFKQLQERNLRCNGKIQWEKKP